jgi:acyl-CoA thioesterase-2
MRNSDVVQKLVSTLGIEQIGENVFRGNHLDLGLTHVFGGQVLAQALTAAYRTVEGRHAHSMHAYFLLPGNIREHIDYEVHRIRDGRSFTTRRVIASQASGPIFNMSASFQIEENGFEHQSSMPDVPQPESLSSSTTLHRKAAQKSTGRIRDFFLADQPIDLRFVDPMNYLSPVKRKPGRCAWFKTNQPIPDDPVMHKCILAYASDFGLLETSLLPHGVTFLNRKWLLQAWITLSGSTDRFILTNGSCMFWTVPVPPVQGVSAGALFSALMGNWSLQWLRKVLFGEYPHPDEYRNN